MYKAFKNKLAEVSPVGYHKSLMHKAMLKR